MARRKNNRTFIPVHKRNNIPSIDELLNKYFESEDGENKKLQDFFKAFYGYLQKSREEKLEEIVDALTTVSDKSIVDEYTRVVSTKFGDPLSVVGSLSGAGGRFNIGNGMGHTKPFPCLYVANDFHTAFTERYHYPPSYLRGDISASKMALEKPTDFMTVEVQINIEKCIDLRNKELLRGFTQVISEIKPTNELKQWARELGYLALRTVQTYGELYRTLLHSEYLKNYFSLEMPSNSQWFGYYCLKSGIQGILYPSVGDKNGHNIAIFIDNFKDTDSFVKLKTETPIVLNDRIKIDSENYEFFKIKPLNKKTLN